jgi:hypothetical protein
MEEVSSSSSSRLSHPPMKLTPVFLTLLLRSSVADAPPTPPTSPSPSSPSPSLNTPEAQRHAAALSGPVTIVPAPPSSPSPSLSSSSSSTPPPPPPSSPLSLSSASNIPKPTSSLTSLTESLSKLWGGGGGNGGSLTISSPSIGSHPTTIGDVIQFQEPPVPLNAGLNLAVR